MIVYKNYNDKKRLERETFSSNALIYMGIGVICLLLLISTACGVKTPQEAKKWVEVEITENLRKHLLDLPEDEQYEQMRDWVVLAFVAHLEPDEKTAFEVLYDFTPLRKDFLESLSNYNYGEARAISLRNRKLYIFVPHHSPKKNVYIARLSDEYRLVHGAMPDKATIIEYLIEIGESLTAKFIETQNINQYTLFSEKMGYYQDLVSNKHELEAFLNKIDDIVYLQDTNTKAVYLGGRKFKNYPTMGVKLEDVAAICQADINKDDLHVGFSLDTKFRNKKFALELSKLAKSGKREVKEWFDRYKKPYEIKEFVLSRTTEIENDMNKFDSVNKMMIDGELSLNSLLNGVVSLKKDNKFNFLSSRNGFSFKELEEQLKRDFEWYNIAIKNNKDILIHIAKRCYEEDLIPYLELRRYLEGKTLIELSVVRTIDSPLDKMILRDVIDMLKKCDYKISEGKKRYDEDIENAVKSFQKDQGLRVNGIIDKDTYLALKNNVSNNQKNWELWYLNYFLHNLKYYNSYLKSRYDGNLQGTEVGMTLFYTDLVMKLWGDDYEMSSPENHILGFKANVNYPLDYSFYEEENKNQYSRYWLGPLESGYDFYNNNFQLYFAHIATRIFCKSSDPLFPDDVEAEAKPSSARFTNWWNYHYSEVADYEQQYHRLNQIVKWSVIIHWLKEKNKIFDFLKEIEVTKNIDFQHWYKTNKSLKAKVSIPFLDERHLGEKTECLNMIWSRPYIEFANFEKNFFNYNAIVGGVSLSTKFKVATKMGIPKNPSLLKSSFIRKGIDFNRQTTARNFTLRNGANFDINSKNYTTLIKNNTAKLRSANAEFRNLTINRQISVTGKRLKINQLYGDFKINDFNSFKYPGKIKFSNTSGELTKAQTLLKKISTNTAKTEKILNSSGDFKYVLKTGNNKYIAQFKKTNNWGELSSTTEKGSNFNIVTSNKQGSYNQFRFLDGFHGTSEVQRYGWHRFNTKDNTILSEITNTAPKNAKGTVYLSKGSYTTKAEIAGDSFYIRNSATTFKNDVDILKTISSQQNKGAFDLLRKRFIDKNNVNGYIFDKNGKIISISRQQGFSKAQTKLAGQFFRESKGQIKKLIFSDQKSVRIIGDDILQVPYNMSKQQMKIFRFISRKTGENGSWVKIFRNTENITAKDIKILQRLDNSNLKLGESYYPFKSVKNLPDNYALVDFNTSASRPQLLIRTQKGGIKVLDVNGPMRIKVQKIGENLNKYYSPRLNKFSNANKKLNYKTFVKETKDFANLQREAIKATGAKVFITKGPRSLDPALISKIHKLPRSIRFIRDQEDVEKSVRNAKMGITPKFKESVFLSTVDLKDDDYEDISNVYTDIVSTGVNVIPNLITLRFLFTLVDKQKTQIVLVIRATDNGLVFSNRIVSFDEISKWLEGIKKEKEMLYIISNKADQLQQFFARSGKFNYVISSNFKPGDPESLKIALSNVYRFYSEFAVRKSILKSDEYNRIITKYPDLSKALLEIVRSKDRLYISPKVKGLTGVGHRTFKFKTIESIIDKIQLNTIRNLQNAGQKSLIKIIRAIPTLKVENRIPKNNRNKEDIYGQFGYYNIKSA